MTTEKTLDPRMRINSQQTGSVQLLRARYYVVQFREPLNLQHRAALEARGFRVHSYIPDDALLVQVPSAEALAEIENWSEVQGTLPYLPEFRVSEELTKSAATRGGGHISLHLRVIHPDEIESVWSKLRILGVEEVLRVADKNLIAYVPVEKLELATRIEGVEWAEENTPMMLHDFSVEGETSAPGTVAQSDLTGYESGTKVMGFDSAYKRGFMGKGQVVGIADTGLDTGVIGKLHADLSGVFKGYGLQNGGKWNDTSGHGTHVAGSVGGNGASSSGKIRGGAYQARMVMHGMWDSFAESLLVPGNLDKIFKAAYGDGARIHTNSWGSVRNAYDNYAAQVDDFMWKHPDMLILFAAGNNGMDFNKDGRIDEGSVSSPSTAKNCLTVGASENLVSKMGNQTKLSALKAGAQKWGVEPIASDTLSNNINGLAGFSSRGPTRDGRIKPDVVAPGTNILSTRSSQPEASPMWGAYNDKYIFAGGTSMATPLTAGAAAVVREYLMRHRKFGAPSASLIKGVLIHSAKDMFPGQYGTGSKQEIPVVRPNNQEGYGRVDLSTAMNLDNSTMKDDGQGVATNETKAFQFGVGRAQKVIVSLHYTDAPAAVSAAKALVNDLDVVVVDPKGRTFQKNDRLNNNEMIEISNPVSGTYKVFVKGVRVAVGKNNRQPFALIMSPMDYKQ